MHGDETLIVVTGTGKVDGSWKSVGFKMTVSETAKSTPKAKELLQETVNQLEGALAALRDKGVEIKDEDVRANYHVDKAMAYRDNRQVFAGYTATYSCSFTTKNVERVSEIQDLLTSMSEKVEVDNVVFQLAFAADLRKAATAKAWEAVYAKVDQTLPPDIKREDLTITTISTGDDRGGGFEGRAMVASALSASATPIKLSAGKPEVTVTLTVGYERTW